MTLGAISIPTDLKPTTANWVGGNKKYRVRNVVLGTGANYPTGGEPIAATDVGLSKTIDQVHGTLARATAAGATARTVAYDRANGKLQIYTTGSAEAANNSDQSAFTARLTFIGT